jgi:hypothetical protein
MVRTTDELMKRAPGKKSYDFRRIVEDTAQFLDQNEGTRELVYKMKEAMDGEALKKVQNHYAGYDWQVAQEGLQLRFKYFKPEEIENMSGKLEKEIDASLDTQSIVWGGRVIVPIPGNPEPLVLENTLDRYRKADPYMNVSIRKIPGIGSEAVFEHDAARLTEDYYNR